MENLFDYSQSMAGELLKKYEEIWQAVPQIKSIVEKLTQGLGDEYAKVSEGVFVHKAAKVDALAKILPPCIICEGAEIRRGAFLRGGVLVGKGCVVGASVELKNAILFNGAKVPHLAYVGDSILGHNVHFGAGVKVSNQKSDKSKIVLKMVTQKVDTSVSKFGALVGDCTEVGCNAVLCPGSVVGKNCTIYPLTLMRGFLPSNTIFKQNGQKVTKIEPKTAQKLAFFGTDGLRGMVGKSLGTKEAYTIGRVLGKEPNAKIVVGRDTRLSSKMLQSALSAGICESGSNVLDAGVTTTPELAFLARSNNANFGVMITASHNPYHDNGIKIFDSEGKKLKDDQLVEIEKFLSCEKSIESISRATQQKVGKILRKKDARSAYLLHLAKFCTNLSGLRVGLDMSNGSASKIAPAVFRRLGASVLTMGAMPNGTNINEGCGSLFPKRLCELVKEKGLDVGFAFDGDADRVIAVDEKGNVANGDQILYVLALHMKQKGLLKNNKIAVTKMSNLGLSEALAELGIGLVQTEVGDKFVFEAMKQNNLFLGGENSGHIIFGDATTGDGILTAIVLSKILCKAKKPLSSLLSKMQLFPRTEVNLSVKNKENVQKSEELQNLIDQKSRELGPCSKIVVRASGTQNCVRVLVECKSQKLCQEVADTLSQKINEVCGKCVE